MITMRSLTVVRKGTDVVVIYVMEIDVNIVWPMDFVRWIILSILEAIIEAFQVPLRHKPRGIQVVCLHIP